MTLRAPRIDSRTSGEVVGQVKELLAAHTAKWPDFHPDKGASRALIEIFGRFAELIIARLNQVPEKNFLAFLDMIGASLLPPQPARAPLTFSLVNGSIQDGLVPAGTQIAAAPAEGETTPVIFETEAELVVTAAQLVSVFVREPKLDFYADNTLLINSVSDNGVPAFRGRKDLQHIFYLGHDTLLSYPGLQQLKLDLNASKQPPVSFQAQWEKWDGEEPWTKIPASIKAGDGFRETTDAKEYLTGNGQLFFNDISPFRRSTVGGIETSWLRCRLLETVVPSDDLLPEILSINMTATIGNPQGKPLPVEAAFANSIQVDATKDFFPFGEKPRAGDTLYLAHKQAFSEKGAVVTLNVGLRSPGVEAGSPQVTWEFWDGRMWSALNKDFSDSTKGFTQSKGAVKFTFPEQPQASIINGVESFWVRVRIVSGNYGEEAHYELDATGKKLKIDEQTKGYTIIPATFKPPAISSITIDYTLTKQSAPQFGLSYNDYHTFEVCFAPDTFKLPSISTVAAGYTLTKKSESEFALAENAFKFFRPNRDTDPTLYLGFTIPSGLEKFPNRKVSLYAALAEFKDNDTPAPVSPSGAVSAERGAGATTDEQPKLIWEYSSGAGWSELTVRDYTETLTKSGLIEFLAPPDFSDRDEFGLNRYWLRVAWKSGNYLFEPEIRGLLINTAMAAQAVAIKDEVVGSSDGSKNQKFHTTRTPILEGQQLYVREPEEPPASELKKIEEENAGKALHLIRDDTGRPKEIWVRWQQAPDFYGSAPRDRHYVLDHLTGEVRFGDGHNGLIPPAGVGNIRMSLYRTGGGVAGNKPAGRITQLRTTVPYVDRVINHIAASGGAEAETYETLVERMPQMIRHGGSAITYEDYEDLARLASPAVARARSVRFYKKDGVGKVKLVIVPGSTDPRPVPSLELKKRVQEYIDERKSPLARLSVEGPKYVEVNVTVDIAATSLEGANELKLAVLERLNEFLHPLAGGFNGEGWDFGRRPHDSDLYFLIEGIPGVDHIEDLKMELSGNIEAESEQHLIASGRHEVNCRFQP
jgi:baseplate J-like protein